MSDTKRKVVVPKINAFVYRVSQQEHFLGLESNKGVINPIWMEEVSDLSGKQDRIKGMEHEQTALFGGVLDLNVATDPQNTLFDRLLPDDHVEVFYKDLVDKADKKAFLKVIPVETYLSKQVRKTPLSDTENPKFVGVAWKGELIEKPSQVTTKIKAWDYHRMLQYMNIPRGQSKSTWLKFIDIDVFKTPSEGEKPKRAKRSNFEVKPNNDLLDYVDHTVQTYLKEGDKKDSVFMFPSVPRDAGDENPTYFTVERKFNPLNLIGFTFSELTGDSVNDRLAVKLDIMMKDYPVLEKVMKGVNAKEDPVIAEVYNSNKLHDDTIIENSTTGTAFADGMIDKIDRHISEQQTMCITRFMDADINIHGGWEQVPRPNGPQAEPKDPVWYRVIGEIVAIDQFAMAHLLAAGMTYDHGISEWFTPIPVFNATIKDGSAGTNRSASEGERSFPITTSRLVYVRWYASQYKGSPISRATQSMERIAVFNLDSYGSLNEFFSRSLNLNLQTISLAKLEYIKNAAFMREPYFLSMVLGTVSFPQKAVKHQFYWRPKTNYFQYADIAIQLEGDNKLDLSNDNGGDQFRKLMIHQHNNISGYSSMMNAAFELDDKLIGFMTNIPASYMRADIYTGSRFKTYAYDSLSIIRVIQILSSVMRGFPATNNPVHTGQQAVPEGSAEKVVKVDHYPIFMANRVIVKSKIIWVTRSVSVSTTSVLQSTTVVQRYKGYSSVTASINDDKIQGDNKRQSGRMFLILEADFKKQVYKKDDASFKIPLGDVNDLSIVKGSANSHLVHFSFGDHAHFIKSLDVDDLLSVAKPALSYNMGARRHRQVSPAQFSPVTLIDMTQNDTYDPLLSRATSNIKVEIKEDTTGGFPIYDPGLAYTLGESNSKNWDGGHYVISNLDTRTSKVVNNSVIKTDYNNNKDSIDQSVYLNKLVSVSTYVNFTDIINELLLLQNFADPTKFTAAPVDYENTDTALFDNISVLSPYTLEKVINSNDKVSYKLAPSDNPDQSLSEFLGKNNPDHIIHDFLKLRKTPEDMAWIAPLSGHILEFDPNAIVRLSQGNISDGKAFSKTISYSDDNIDILFRPFFDMYLVISYLDLIVKGLRYLMWTISKSRFVGHVYLPMNYAGYSQDRTGTEDDLEPGSSIVFKIESGNVKNKTIGTGLLAQLSGKADNVLIQGQSQHQLEAIETSIAPIVGGPNPKQPMIWYVSKKIVYIGEDSGAMMRLNMTEGSFDWTVFYREDTQMTKMSEYFLMNGMGNFFLGRGGE